MTARDISISELLFENTTDAKIGFTIAVVLGYCLYKLMGMKSRNVIEVADDDTEYSNVEFTDKSDHFKLLLVVRTDLKMGKGKIASQCAHAAVLAYRNATKCPSLLRAWEACGQAKIAVKVDSEKALKEVAKEAKAIGLLANIVKDAGHTQIKPGSLTVCAIGPGPTTMVDRVTGHLKLL